MAENRPFREVRQRLQRTVTDDSEAIVPRGYHFRSRHYSPLVSMMFTRGERLEADGETTQRIEFAEFDPILVTADVPLLAGHLDCVMTILALRAGHGARVTAGSPDRTAIRCNGSGQLARVDRCRRLIL
jgi:hypothetical protein